MNIVYFLETNKVNKGNVVMLLRIKLLLTWLGISD